MAQKIETGGSRMSTTTTETPTEAWERFQRWIARTGFSDRTQGLYKTKVRIFLDWLAADEAGEYAEALTDQHVRDYAVRDFRRHLMVDQKAATATVESYVSAIGTLYEYLGLGRPNVRRAPKEQSSPKSLSDDELRAVLRAAERRGARDFAIAMTIFSCGPRVESVHKLNTDDLFLSDRMGRLEVRYGKGGEATTHPVPADARDALRRWLAVRREQGAPELGPLFTARGGGRLSVRRMQSLMGDLARESGKDVRLTPHVLRHTFARKFLESGGDVGQLQRLLGHKHLSSTQVYTNVRTDQLDAAVEGVRIDL